jgi:hypothetical protein
MSLPTNTSVGYPSSTNVNPQAATSSAGDGVTSLSDARARSCRTIPAMTPYIPVCWRAAAVLFGILVIASPATAQTEPTAPKLTFAFEARVMVGTPMELGTVPEGRRRIIPITGGTFEGPGIKGRILNHGADWQIVRPDGFADLDTRYALETDTGHIIYVQNKGMRHASDEVMKLLNAGQPVDPSVVYFRTVPVFETGAPELQWLTRSIFVGTGERHPNEVVIRFWKLE